MKRIAEIKASQLYYYLLLYDIIYYYLLFLFIIIIILCRPTFGFLRKIERNEFVDCIDDENPNVFVVFHLYQEVTIYLLICIIIILITLLFLL